MFSYLKTVTKICVTEGQKTCLHNFGGKHLWYDAVLDWGLNPGPPALEASTIPLGYRGGSNYNFKSIIRTCG